MTATPSIRDHYAALLRKYRKVRGGECVPAYRMRSRPQTRGCGTVDRLAKHGLRQITPVSYRFSIRHSPAWLKRELESPEKSFVLMKFPKRTPSTSGNQVTDAFSRDGQGSGIDWGSITQVIVDQYGGRLELLQHILQNPESKRNVTEQVAEVRSQILIVLTPYMFTSAIPPNPTDPVDWSWIDPVVKHRASTHTARAQEALITRQEKVIKEAVEEVLYRICSILGDIWMGAFDSAEADVEELERFLRKWQSNISELMDWLDWSMWLKCDPACGPEVSSRLVLLTGSLNQ